MTRKPAQPEWDAEGVPSANYVQVLECDNPQCGFCHFVLFNEDDEPIAEAIMDRKTSEDVREDLRKFFGKH